MSTPEVTKAYMYGWMILQLHTQGYTQLVSRYLRGVHNIPYKQFYDRLYELLQEDDKLKVIFNFVEQFEKAYITTGVLPDPEDIDPTIVVPKLGGHFTAQMSMDMIYKNRESVYALAEQIVNEFGFYNERIIKMNRDHLFDDEKDYQPTYISDYDIEEWTAGECEYELEPYISKKRNIGAVTDSVSASKKIKAIQQRRRGLKNHFKKLDN
jgi:hypothetical protein